MRSYGTAQLMAGTPGAIDYPNALKATEHAAEVRRLASRPPGCLRLRLELCLQYEEQLNGTLASAPTEPGARKHASKAVLQYYQARSKLVSLLQLLHTSNES